MRTLEIDNFIKDIHGRWSIRESCDSVTLESSHPHLEDSDFAHPAQIVHTYECKNNEVAYFKVDINLISVLPDGYLGIVLNCMKKTKPFIL